MQTGVKTRTSTESQARTNTVEASGIGHLIRQVVTPGDAVIATVGDAEGIEQLIETTNDFARLTVRAVVDTAALRSTNWATLARAESLRRTGKLSIRRCDFGDRDPRPEVVSTSGTWGRCLAGGTAAVVDDPSEMDRHRQRWNTAEPVGEITDCTLAEYRNAVTEEIDERTADIAVSMAEATSDGVTALVLAAAVDGTMQKSVSEAISQCGHKSLATLSRRLSALSQDGRVVRVPVSTNSGSTNRLVHKTDGPDKKVIDRTRG